MRLSRPGADIFVPSGEPLASALKRATLLGVAAHPDDLECMAYAPIVRGFTKPAEAFAGLVLTSGSGSVRAGAYKGLTDKAMARVRQKEQRKAAVIGDYALMVQLGHPSRAVLDPAAMAPIDDMEAVLRAVRPCEVYTHELADRHPTHVGVALKLVAAIRRLPKSQRPSKLVGCEVWRSLDWLSGRDKLLMRVDGREPLGDALLGVFDSQLSAKRYDQGARGRRRANAVFSDSHVPGGGGQMLFGMDLTPLIKDDKLRPQALLGRYLASFQAEVLGRLEQLGGAPKRGVKP
jgi:LmbE family N-acetylglucosaminyl deacetylase